MKTVVFLFHENDPQMASEVSMARLWWQGILENMGYEVMYYDYANFNFDRFYSEIKEAKPDFIIHACYDALHTEFVKLREIAKTFVIQSDDDYRFDTYARFWIPIVDGIISFCGSREAIPKAYYACGATEKTLMHGYWAFNPNMMSYDQTHERTTPVIHVGGVHADRLQKFKEFDARGLPVLATPHLLYSEFKQKVSSSKVALAFTMAATMNLRQLKGRLFELPYFSLMAAEPFPDMETYYDLDKEILVFNSVQEAVEKIQRVLKNDALYTQMQEAGRKRLLSQHTCYHVWDRFILPKMDPDYKPVNVTELLKTTHGIIV